MANETDHDDDDDHIINLKPKNNRFFIPLIRHSAKSSSPIRANADRDHSGTFLCPCLPYNQLLGEVKSDPEEERKITVPDKICAKMGSTLLFTDITEWSLPRVSSQPGTQ